jgi:hypothetical protein
VSTILEHHPVEVYGTQVMFQPVEFPVELAVLETRIQILEAENARLQEALEFFLEICCSDE